MILSPSMMCADLKSLSAEVVALIEAGADVFHLDMMDNKFVPNVALTWDHVAQIRQATRTKIDLHLMVIDPGNYLATAVRHKVDIIYVHFEAGDAASHLRRIRMRGIEAGLVVNAETELDQFRHLLPAIDRLLVMRVRPGFAGQKALPQVEEKIARICDIKKGFHLGIDGSVSLEVVKKWASLGVDEFVLGTSSLFGKADTYRNILSSLRNVSS